MGFVIRAAIAVTTASAVAGIARVYKASKDASQAMDGVGDASEKAGKRSKSGFERVTQDLKSFRESVTGFTGMFTPKFGLMDLIFGKSQGAKRRFPSLNTAIRGVNTLARVSGETRMWYKLLTKETDKRHSAKGVRGLQRSVTKLRDTVKQTKSNWAELAMAANAGIQAISGTNLFSDAGSAVMRAFDLARGKEDARIVFDSIIGDARKTDSLLSQIYKKAAETPFQKSDMVEGSKRLLRLTRDNVDANMQLVNLTTQMAALNPSKNITDASEAILDAAAGGGFERLKEFGVTLRAEMFKSIGDPGSKAWGDAVIKRIQTEFTSMTGGRDVVKALSTSITGMMSTLKDTVDLPLSKIGVALVEKFNVKDVIRGATDNLVMFGDAMDYVLNGIGDPSSIPPGIMVIAEAIKNAIDIAVRMKQMVGQALQFVWDWWNKLDKSAQKFILKLAGIGSAFTTITGIIAPLVLGIVAFVSAIAAVWPVISSLFATIASMGVVGLIGAAFVALKAVAAFVISAVFALAPVILTAVGIFKLFRREGESVSDTFVRLFHVIKVVIVAFVTKAWAFIKGFWDGLVDGLTESAQNLWAAFDFMKEPFLNFIAVMGWSTTTAKEWGSVGRWLGEILAWFVEDVVDMVKWVVYGLGVIFRILDYYFTDTLSDLKMLGAAFFDFVAGTGKAGETLKTFLLGIMDILTYPIRMLLKNIFVEFSGLYALAGKILKPFNKGLSEHFETASKVAREYAGTISEGFLKTKRFIADQGGNEIKVKAEMHAEVNTPVQLKMDGEKIAEGQAKTTMRARNSGRGGDPMTPEELGFVIDSGRVRTVDLGEVAARS